MNENVKPKPKKNDRGTSGPLLAFFVFILVIGLVTALFLIDAAGGLKLGKGVLVLVLSSYFPLSYVAYETSKRQAKIDRLQEDFMLLGITSEQESQDVAQTLYTQSYGWPNYVLHITLAVLLAVFGVSLLLWAPDTSLISTNTLQAMRYGFLGAYVFAAQLVYRRYTTSDLLPTVYFYCALTLVAGLAFTYTAFEAINALTETNSTEAAKGVSAGFTAVLAFSLGYFPNLAMRWFGRVAYTTFGVQQRRADEFPLGLIDGISQLHETRLGDIGIDNVQNLATTDIRDLLLSTPFSGHQAIYWIDQAILYLYLTPAQIDRLREIGVRTVTDFREMWEQLKGKDGAQEPDDDLALLAAQLQIDAHQLELIYHLTEAGPNLAYLQNYWQSVDEVVSLKRGTYLKNKREQLNEMLEQVATAEPGDAQINRVQAQVQEFRAEIVQKAGPAVPLAPQTARAWVGQGNLHLQAGDIEAAIDAYHQAIAIDPNYAWGYNRLGLAYMQQGRLDEAGAYFGEAVSLAPESASLRNDRGAYYQTVGKLDKAQADLEKAIELDANMLRAYINLGHVYRDQGDIDSAGETYGQALNLDPQSAMANNSLAWLYATNADRFADKMDEALEMAQKAVVVSQQADGRLNPTYLDTLGVVRWKRGELEAARDTLRQAQNLGPSPQLAQEIDQHLQDVEETLQQQG